MGLRASGTFAPACPTCGEIVRDSDDLPLTFDALEKKRQKWEHGGLRAAAGR